MAALRQHQYNFMRMAFTGIPEGTDVAGLIRSKHSRLAERGLGAAEFDAVAAELVGTLQELNVPANLIDEVVAIVGPLRDVFDGMAKEQAA